MNISIINMITLLTILVTGLSARLFYAWGLVGNSGY